MSFIDLRITRAGALECKDAGEEALQFHATNSFEVHFTPQVCPEERKKGDVIYHAGDQGTSMWFIASGTIKAFEDGVLLAELSRRADPLVWSSRVIATAIVHVKCVPTL